MPGRDAREALRRLEADGLLCRSGPRLRPTRRWQTAMARAAFRLAGSEEPERAELRIAIVATLLEIYGAEMEDETLADLVEAILPIEAEELAPRARGEGANSSAR